MSESSSTTAPLKSPELMIGTATAALRSNPSSAAVGFFLRASYTQRRRGPFLPSVLADAPPPPPPPRFAPPPPPPAAAGGADQGGVVLLLRCCGPLWGGGVEFPFLIFFYSPPPPPPPRSVRCHAAPRAARRRSPSLPPVPPFVPLCQVGAKKFYKLSEKPLISMALGFPDGATMRLRGFDRLCYFRSKFDRFAPKRNTGVNSQLRCFHRC